MSDAIISVDESLIQTDSSYSTSHSSKQGIRIHCKQSTSDIEVIYNGYSSNFWQKLPESNLQGDIISVSAGLSERRRFILKGIDLLFELAVRKPEIKITVVGSHKLPEGIIKPANVTIVGNASPELLRELYSGHTYYAQLSISEGFPNAICEAMLCECIPIGSNVAAMPKIIGKEGYLLHKRSIDDLENLINLANKEWSMKSFSPRKRIMEHFSIETRKERMLEFIRNLHSAGLKN
ncbi:MAG: glycosyltransferase family 4 protein [Bacteroidia bacterium]